jgi:MGT family glycosyltransferase
VLRDPDRTGLPTPHHFVGSCVRPVPALDADTRAWLEADEPFVYASLGTFLSARHDVLRNLVKALAGTGRRVAMATGSTDVSELGPVPSGWLLGSFLPQIPLVSRADAVVCHGGNNTVTEALTAGQPLLVLPLSTDQFAIAADVERAGVGRSADPNATSADELAVSLRALDDPEVRGAAARAARSLAADGGPRRAVTALGGLPGGPSPVSGG